MKILHWDEMFHPTFGYQINVLSKFQAKQGHEVVVMTSENVENHPTFKTFGGDIDIKKEDQNFTDKYGVEIKRLPIHGVYSGRVIYKAGFIDRIIEEDADIIMCHTNDTLSAMLIALQHKKINKPIIFDNHMLEMASKNPLSKAFRGLFKRIITPLIIKNQWVVIKTQDDPYVNKCLGIPENLTPFLSFGSDTTIFHPDEAKKASMRSELGIKDDDFVVLYTGKLTPDKGGQLLADAFKNKISQDKEVVLIVVGNSPSDDYGQLVEETFKKSENRVIRIPTQKYIDLPIYYQMADLSVFAKQASLSFYDAQACGLPVISESNYVNDGRLQFDNGTSFIENDLNDFISKIQEYVDMGQRRFDEISNNAINFVKENYDYENIAKEYTKLMVQEINRFYGYQKFDEKMDVSS